MCGCVCVCFNLEDARKNNGVALPTEHHSGGCFFSSIIGGRQKNVPLRLDVKIHNFSAAVCTFALIFFFLSAGVAGLF